MPANHSCFVDSYYLKLGSFRNSLTAINIVTSLSAILFNTVILFTIVKTKSLHNPSYLLIGNLSLTDFLVGLLVQPASVIISLTYKQYKGAFCVFMFIGRVAGYWLGIVSLFTLTLISVDRAIALKYKNRYRAIVTIRHIIGILVPWWIGTFILVFTLSYCNLSPSLTQTVVTIFLGVLCTILISCYGHAYYNLKKMSSSVVNAASPGSKTGAVFHITKYRRTLNTMMIVLLAVVAFYLPFFCCSIFISSNNILTFKEDKLAKEIYKFLLVCEVVVTVNSSVNPLLYLWRIKDLRQAVKRTLNFDNNLFHRNQGLVGIERKRIVMVKERIQSTGSTEQLQSKTTKEPQWRRSMYTNNWQTTAL